MLTGGFVRKGGRNAYPSQITERPAPPAAMRAAPPMRVVHQGWLCWAEREVQSSTLERYDEMRSSLRKRLWWRGLNARWKRL